MAHKIKELFKKRQSFQEMATDSSNEIKVLFGELSERLDKVEATLEELVNKK